MPKRNFSLPPKVCPEVTRLSLSVTEAAEATSLSKSTLYNMMSDGTLPYTQIRGRRLIAVSTIEALLAPTAKEA